MPDLEERLQGADRVGAPDLWDQIESRARAPQAHGPSRLVTIALSLAVAAAGTVGLFAAFFGRGGPAALPANGVFVYADEGPQPPEIPFDNVDLFAFDPATGKRTNLTNTPTVAEMSPVWSPDGSRVVYERASAEGEAADLHVTHDLVVANADGGDPRVIRECGRESCGVTDIAWSPDNARLAWTTDKRVGDGFVLALEVHDLGTGTTRELCDSRSCGWAGQLAWSPDGTSIAFSEAGTGRLGLLIPAGPIWLADATAGDVRALTPDTGPCGPISEGCVFDSAPVWSPDGASIAFVRTVSGGQPGATTDVMVIDVDGTNEGSLSECVSNDQCQQGPLAWSPAGTPIALFQRYRPTALSLVDPATGEVTEIPLPFDVGESAYSVRWSPDGTWVSFIGGPARASNLYVADASIGEVDLAAEGIARQGAIMWLPDGAIDLSTVSSPPTTTSTPEPTAPVPAGTIVFASSNGSNREDEGVEIWTIAPAGSDVTRLTDNEFFDGDPTPSPDGTRIAFRSYRPGDRTTQVYVLDSDGSNQHALRLAGRVRLRPGLQASRAAFSSWMPMGRTSGSSPRATHSIRRGRRTDRGSPTP